MLLPHNDDVIKPRALKTFMDGLAELGINKGLIQNKRILAEVLEKEQAYRDKNSEAQRYSVLVFACASACAHVVQTFCSALCLRSVACFEA